MRIIENKHVLAEIQRLKSDGHWKKKCPDIFENSQVQIDVRTCPDTCPVSGPINAYIWGGD